MRGEKAMVFVEPVMMLTIGAFESTLLGGWLHQPHSRYVNDKCIRIKSLYAIFKMFLIKS